MLDSRCTTDAITLEMTRIADLKVYELKEQVPLQLSTKGSQTKINYGAKVCLEYGPVNADHYLDIVNIDRYDVTLGMVFMRKHRIVLHFDKNQVRQQNVVLPTLQEDHRGSSYKCVDKC